MTEDDAEQQEFEGINGLERADNGTLKVTWSVLEKTDEDIYFVPCSHADAMQVEFAEVRADNEHLVSALIDALNGGDSWRTDAMTILGKRYEESSR